MTNHNTVVQLLAVVQKTSTSSQNMNLIIGVALIVILVLIASTIFWKK